MGKIYVVGFGSGDREFMTIEAEEVLKSVDIIVGYTAYIDMIKNIFPDKNYLSTPMKREIDRCKMALNEALSGKTVAIVSSGDSGIYGMAGIMLEVVNQSKANIEVEMVAGVTSACLASAVLGAPLMHDFAVISLSDLMTPLSLIYKRVECSAESDFVICLYNPKSKKRTEYINKSAEIIMKYRSLQTPVGIVRHAGRKQQSSVITTLENLDKADIDMFCIVIIGNSNTYTLNNRMITPRGYKM